ncbi:unnamed protein product [Cuscuta campestris]|uniref:Cystatin domain-containing protein n=2 Tax=Cuscuta sect. Cleistogrammica TaxID=1824901 RepID=A0A484MKX1_9ASTE|nr:hypothetical protein DM860_003058 [Cuscuta australis]VFQ89623.1 unnamed protein product [Cuscuta campestris]
MALNSRIVLFLVVASAALLSPSPAASDSLVGGWGPIVMPPPPYVVEIGRFAVAAINKAANTTLEFERVVKGEEQVVAGTNYRLVVATKAAGKMYEAVVWDRSWLPARNLTSFKPYDGASNLS